MSKIILISGQQGSGKSTLADRLWDHFSDSEARVYPLRLKFADPLYAANEALKDVMEPFGIPVKEKEGEFLQFLGTEWGRKRFGEDVWVNALKKQLATLERMGGNKFVIIDDCRFPNEFEAFPDALRIRLHAPEEDRKKRTKEWRPNTGHQSETALNDYESKFELVIDTGVSSKEETFKKVLDMITLKFSEQI